MPKPKKSKIQSVSRAMQLLELIALHGGQAKLAQLSILSGLEKTTIHGLLSTLQDMGYVENEPRGWYRLGYRLVELTKFADMKKSVLNYFSNLVDKAVNLSNETAYLAIPSGSHELLFLDYKQSNENQVIECPLGKTEYIYSSALGKVLLSNIDYLLRAARLSNKVDASLQSELEKIKSQGFALDLAITEHDINCVAVPLYLDGKVVAALGISGASKNLPKSKLVRLAKEIWKL